MMKCEFCENYEIRRDSYASHVKSKHMKDIAYLMLEDFKDCNVNTISSYASEHKTTSMPIYSKMYQDAEYWFGVKPLFYIRESIEVPYDESRPDAKLKPYQEDEELRQYLKREENLIAHRQFIDEVLQSISLFDFIKFQKDLVIRHPDVLHMKKELSALQARHSALEESSKKEVEYLKREAEMWKETADEKECIADLKRDLYSTRSYAQQVDRTVSSLKQQLELKDKEYHDQIMTLNQRNLRTETEYYDKVDAQKAENNKLTEELKKEKNDRTVKTSAAVQKAEEKLSDVLNKKFDKERDAWRKEKKALKKENKTLGLKLAAKHDSDSDSGSESDQGRFRDFGIFRG